MAVCDKVTSELQKSKTLFLSFEWVIQHWGCWVEIVIPIYTTQGRTQDFQRGGAESHQTS